MFGTDAARRGVWDIQHVQRVRHCKLIGVVSKENGIVPPIEAMLFLMSSQPARRVFGLFMQGSMTGDLKPASLRVLPGYDVFANPVGVVIDQPSGMPDDHLARAIICIQHMIGRDCEPLIKLEDA
jgi:hypothetical protein